MLTTISIDDDVYTKALKLARGNYQRGLLRGVYDWEGNNLSSKVMKYRASYQRSRINLLNRMLEVRSSYTRNGSVVLLFPRLPKYSGREPSVRSTRSKNDCSRLKIGRNLIAFNK